MITRKKQDLISLAGILLLLSTPTICTMFTIEQYRPAHRSVQELIVTLAFFAIPTIVFYKNIKVYFYLLLPLVILSPVIAFLILFYHIRPGLQLIVLILQTNLAEVQEATQGYMVYFFPISILYTSLYLYFIKKLATRKLPTLVAIRISAIATIFIGCFMFYNFKWYKRPVNSSNFTQIRHYPTSLLGGLTEAFLMYKQNNINGSTNFSFNAFKKTEASQREVYVLVIGESSRYDRWQLNGYPRPTSPRLSQRENIISLSNVVAGSNFTYLSVPQMITRAHPNSMDTNFKEKSILSAFKDAGFKTVWLSNHPKQDLFWSGTIILHAVTADISIFAPNNYPNLWLEDAYDGRLLPLLDSILNSDEQNLFVVLHTMGNHWDYSKRYPKDFDFFKPSGSTQEITPPSARLKAVISNTYDNSIRYADYIIDSVISLVEKQDAVSYVSYISDHGEDLFDSSPSKINFHLTPSKHTLHVPYFIWTSERYNYLYPEKMRALTGNASKPVGSENTFYTLVDMAGVSYNGFDSSKSVASYSFKNSSQYFYDHSLKKPLKFSNVTSKR